MVLICTGMLTMFDKQPKLEMYPAIPIWESVPGVVVSLNGQTTTTPMHPTISVKTVMVKMAINEKGIDI